MNEPNYAYARKMARKVIKDYKLNQVPTDLKKIIEGRGLKFIELNDPTDIDGAILEIEGEPKIAVLNMAKAIPRQRFTLAHELGHIFLNHAKRDIYDGESAGEQEGEYTSKSNKPPKEIEADTFASELLIPYDQLKKNVDKLNNLDELSEMFQVSKQAMTIAITNFWKYSRIK